MKNNEISSEIEVYVKICDAYKRLQLQLKKVPVQKTRQKKIDFTGGTVSVCDIIAYQIGWGRLLLWVWLNWKGAKYAM